MDNETNNVFSDDVSFNMRLTTELDDSSDPATVSRNFRIELIKGELVVAFGGGHTRAVFSIGACGDVTCDFFDGDPGDHIAEVAVYPRTTVVVDDRPERITP